VIQQILGALSGLWSRPTTVHLTATGPRPASLAANAGWSLAGSLGYAVTRWLTVIAIARLGNSTLLGEFVLATAIVAPVYLLAHFQLPTLLVTDARSKVSGWTYLAVRLGVSVIALPVAISLAWFKGGTIAAAVGLLAAGRIVDHLTELAAARLQRFQRFAPGAVALMINGIGTLAATAVVLRAAPTVVQVALASAMGSAVALLALWYGGGADLRPARNTEASWNRLRTEAGGLLKLGLPIGLIMGLASVNASAPALALDHWLGKAQVGAFEAIGYPVLAMTLVIGAVGQAAAPGLAALLAAGECRLLKRHIVSLICFGASLGIVGAIASAIAGNWILSRLYGPEYGVYSRTLTILFVGCALRNAYTYVGVLFFALRRLTVQLHIRYMSLAALVIALVALVPRHGIEGVAWAMLIAAVVEAVIWTALLLPIWVGLSEQRATPSVGWAVAAE